MSNDFKSLFELAAARAIAYREQSPSRPPKPSATLDELRYAFEIGLPDQGRDGTEIIEALANAAEPGLIGITSPQFFGWVMGASNPVGTAAEFLAAAWGQNAGIYQTSPAAAVAEEVSAKWLLELLHLPQESSIGFTTGATMASFICLSAARTEVLRHLGWNLERDGLSRAPDVKVLLSEEAHATVHSGLRYLGFGERQKVHIRSDDQCRMSTSDLAKHLSEGEGPKIIISQAGHINSGAFDDFAAISALAKDHGAWHHVDGAFGLWARSVPALAHLCGGIDQADSWSVDGHKWLQVPYDSGFAIVKNAEAHLRAMDITASYIAAGADDGRSPSQYVPELSRRARGFAVWATIQAFGKSGVEEMVARHCRCAARIADALAQEAGISILNDICINQVAVAFGQDDETTEARDQYARQVIDEVRRENTSFVGGATWKGRQILRISVISGPTDEAAVDQLATSIIRAWRLIRT